jgi:pyruvate dehydrogenase phosphatase
MPPIFTRKVLYNLHPGFHESSPWEHFLVRNLTPPYISSEAEVVHRRLSRGKQFLVLCTDGLTDISGGGDPLQAAEDWAWILGNVVSSTKGDMKGKHEGNLAVSLLHQILGGEDVKSVSRALTLELEEPWFDDVAIVVMSL